MINFLIGKIDSIGENSIVLEVNNVGYEVFVINPPKFKLGNKIRIETYYYLREDKAELYGFQSLAEKQFFGLLLGVSGLGPKVAMGVLSLGGAKRIKRAIEKSDMEFLTTAPHIGKKLAGKIILELKNKKELTGSDIIAQGANSELARALQSLGFGKTEIKEVARAIPSNIKGVSAKVAWAVKFIGQKRRK